MAPAPPRLALWLVARRTPAHMRDEVVGDIIEDFSRLAARDPRAARAWCWRQSLASLRPRAARLSPHSSLARRPGGSLMRGLVSDVTFSARLLRQQPLLSLVALLSLVVGLGLNLLLFTVANAALYRPLAVQDPGSLVVFGMQRPTTVAQNFSYSAYQTLASEARGLDMLTAYSTRRAAVTYGNETVSEKGELVSGTYFPGLGVALARGRGLAPSDDHPAAPPAAVVSAALWRARFGDAPLAGQGLVINGITFSIVGVAAGQFQGMFPGMRTDFWIPLSQTAGVVGRDLLTDRGASWLFVVGRLSEGVSRQAARDQLDSVLARVLAENGGQPQPLVARSGARGTDTLSARLEAPLRLLMVAAGLVLLVAGVNVANLQLARNAARQRELAVREALGAGRGRLLRLLLVDGFLLAVPAAAIALALAVAARSTALQLITRFGEPVQLAAPIDTRIWMFTGVATIAVALLIGLLSAWQGARPVASMLAEGGRGETGSRQRLQRAMVVVQFALSMTLLVGATLLVRSIWNLTSTDLGYATDVVMVEVAPGEAQIRGEAAVKYVEEAVTRAAALPGVASAAAAHVMPLDFGGSRMTIGIPGYTPGQDEEMELNFLRVTPGYFETMQIPLLQGRAFDSRDIEGTPLRIVVNETMARRYWPAGNAIGSPVVLLSDGAPDGEVVGVVPDVHYRMVREEPQPSFYMALAQFPSSLAVIHARTQGDPAALVEALRRTVAGVHPRVPVARALSLDAQVRRNIADDRMAVAIGITLGLSALILATAGLYATMAFGVRRRTREIGVRMALGARSSDVSGLVVKQGLGLVAAGALAGLAGAFWAGRTIEGQLYGVSPVDASSFGSATLLLGSAALAAAWIPARRATRVDPVVALRDQ